MLNHHPTLGARMLLSFALLVISFGTYSWSAYASISTLANVDSTSACGIFGGIVGLGVLLNTSFVLLAIRDRYRRTVFLPLIVSSVVGTVLNLSVLGMSVVLSSL